MNARFLVLVIALGACRSEPNLGSTEDPLIQDAVHNGGRAGFYFLPPLVSPTPLPPIFDGSLHLVAKLEGGGSSHAFPLTADAAAQSYHGTLDTSALGLDSAITYRLHVLADGLALGFADVRVFESHATSVATDDNFELVDGKKLKIKVYVNRCATVTCSASACRSAGACEPTTGLCAAGNALPNGTTCSDGNTCNGEDACSAGECNPIDPNLGRYDCSRWDQGTWGP